MNKIGLDYNAVGNHEFDEGATELLRMQNGGCHPVDGCLDGDGFAGADFRFLAANVVNRNTGKTLFVPFHIDNVGGAKVAFVGMTLEGTPLIVTPSGIADYDFKDEADTVNALVPKLKAAGADAIVVLLHEGGFPSGGFNECPGISGPIVDIVNRVDPAVDMVLSGHTHQAYNCRINGKLVTSASSAGRLVTDVHLTVDKGPDKHDNKPGRVTSVSADNLIVTRDVAKDPDQSALIAKYAAIAAPLQNRIIGSISADLVRAQSPAGEIGRELGSRRTAVARGLAHGELWVRRHRCRVDEHELGILGVVSRVEV
jgi:5'-nucleotidase